MASLFTPTAQAGLSGSAEVFYPSNAGSIFGSGHLIESGIDITNPKGVISFWFNSASMADGQRIMRVINTGPTAGIATVVTSSGFLVLSFIRLGENAGPGAAIANIAAYGDGKWHHVLCSWDSTINPEPNWLINSYIDDVQNCTVTFAFGGIVTAGGDWTIGRDYDGTQTYTGELAEFYVYSGVYMDLNIVENRRKFITASRRPAFLGTDGSLPTGSVPGVYLKKADGINSGSGGNFTIIGLLGITTTTPSSP